MRLIDRVLSRSEFQDAPPVLIDVGSAGGVHRAWKRLAPYAVCVAFDPDARDSADMHAAASHFRRLHICRAAVVPNRDGRDTVDVYLTRAPHCSSLLEPDAASLQDWRFAELFEVERRESVPCIDLPTVANEFGLATIDWFKSDSQGLDLRLFQSLPEPVRDRTLAVEFEPGLIDAYRGEDKLPATLTAMDRPEFWLSKMEVRGTQRIRREYLSRLNPLEQRTLGRTLPTSPGWAELTYLNTLRGNLRFGVRDWLLAWVIATLQSQHGFALDLAARASAQFDDSMFRELERASLRRIRRAAHVQWPVLAARGALRRAAALFW
jgi:FkbM family methyltransferase